MTLQLAAPIGSQRPRIENVPPRVSSAGQEAVELAAMAGLALDPWQQYALDGELGEDARGRWVANEVGLVVPRQNGKGGIIEAATLAGMFLFGEAIVYTAHLMSTSRKMQERIQVLIESTPDLDREVKQIRTSNEERSIELRSRARIDFAARSESNARGWSADRVFLDEAFAVTVAMVGALMPVMFARLNWQLWWVSMAGKIASAPLRRIRKRAIGRAAGLAYHEWSVDEDVYRENPEAVARDPAALAQANPAVGIRIDLATLLAAQESMDPGEFAREVLCIWDDEHGAAAIDPVVWAELADPDSQIDGRPVFALDCSPGLASGAIGTAGYRADGIPHVEITGPGDGTLDHRQGVDWMVPRAKELDERWHPTWVLDPTGPAGALVSDLQEAGIEWIPVSGQEWAQACGAFYAAVVAPERDQLRHLGQQAMQAAVEAAKWRDVGDGAKAWGRRASNEDICPLAAGTLALHGLVVYGGGDPLDNIW